MNLLEKKIFIYYIRPEKHRMGKKIQGKDERKINTKKKNNIKSGVLLLVKMEVEVMMERKRQREALKKKSFFFWQRKVLGKLIMITTG